MSKITRLVAATAAASILSLSLATPSLAAPATKPCAEKVGTRVPVVMVHGWNSKGAAWGKTSDKASMAHAVDNVRGVYLDKPFDYSLQNQSWVTNKAIGPKLAQRIACLAAASRAGGGMGKVIVIGHSMGGLAARYAASQKVNGRPVAEDLGLVITIGTPNSGSQWGHVAEDVLGPLCWVPKKVSYTSDNNPCALTAMKALALGSNDLAKLPWIPKQVPVLALAGDVALTTPLFGLTIMHTSSDLIVGTPSALDYGKHQEYNSTRGPNTAECKLAVDALQRMIANVAFGGMPKCWHSALLRNTETQGRVTSAIKKYLSTGLSSFLGTWNVHGTEVVIRGDGTGSMYNRIGPCAFDGALADILCAERIPLTYQQSGPKLVFTVGKPKYLDYDTGEPVNGYIVPESHLAEGDTFEIRRKSAHLLEVAWTDTRLGGLDVETSNTNLCDEYARNGFRECGA